MRFGQWVLFMAVLTTLSSVLFSLDQGGYHAVAWSGIVVLIVLTAYLNRSVARRTRGSHE
jgi:hypothetical protein